MLSVPLNKEIKPSTKPTTLPIAGFLKHFYSIAPFSLSTRRFSPTSLKKVNTR